MRAKAFENLLKRIEDTWDNMPISDDVCWSEQWTTMQALVTKSKILRSRQNDEAVIRELINQEK